MKKLFALIMAAAICLPLCACGAPADRPVAYQNDFLGIKLEYPGNWDLRDNKKDATLREETGLELSIIYTAEDNMSAVFSVSVYPAVPDLLDYDVEADIMSSDLEKPQDIESSVVTFMGDENTLFAKYTHRLDSFRIQTEQYMQIRGEWMFVFAFSVEKKRYTEVEEGFVKIRSTLEYTTEPTGEAPTSALGETAGVTAEPFVSVLPTEIATGVPTYTGLPVSTPKSS